MLVEARGRELHDTGRRRARRERLEDDTALGPGHAALLATLQGHTSVNAVASYTTQAGAVRVVSGSDDNTAKIWDPDTQRLLATLQGHTDDRVRGRELHDTGRRRARRERLGGQHRKGVAHGKVEPWRRRRRPRRPRRASARPRRARPRRASGRGGSASSAREWSPTKRPSHDAALAARFANVDGARLHAATAGDEDDDPLGALLDEIELSGLAPRKAARAALEPFLAKLRAHDDAAARERQRAAEAKREAEERARARRRAGARPRTRTPPSARTGRTARRRRGGGETGRGGATPRGARRPSPRARPSVVGADGAARRRVANCDPGPRRRPRRSHAPLKRRR